MELKFWEKETGENGRWEENMVEKMEKGKQ